MPPASTGTDTAQVPRGFVIVVAADAAEATAASAGSGVCCAALGFDSGCPSLEQAVDPMTKIPPMATASPIAAAFNFALIFRSLHST